MKGKRKVLEYSGLILLLILYVAAAVFTPRMARSDDMLIIGNARLPVSTFAGVFSSIANICIICLVVFYKKPGFITALCALLFQFPFWIWTSITQRSLASIPGLFSSLLAIIAIVMIRVQDRQINRYQQDEVDQLKKQEALSQRLFEQTATALVTAIDAKDEYSHGHSIRVAEYSKRIARMMGKSEEECRNIYYAGLLHDVGKLGIPDAIITKKSELTPEEYEEIKTHPVLGCQILSSIKDHPYIIEGAHYHHERYDGLGYPDGLKGGEIPEVARIISVADAYDTLSSNRSYRSAIPQQLIREEIVMGAGSQFDPEMAMIMRHLIDMDSEFHMKEQQTARHLAGDDSMHCGEYRNEISEGIIITQETTRIRLSCRSEGTQEEQNIPAVILFDSLDARVHENPREIQNLNYYEYCEIWLNGKTVNHGARAIKTTVTEHQPAAGKTAERTGDYAVSAVKCRDHVLVRIDDGRKTTEVTAALPDSTRFAYLALTGRHCVISGIRVDKDPGRVPDNLIRRIAGEVSYIDCPAGDLPNIQIDSIRSASSKGIAVKDGMKLTFHTMSLPTARLIWHCPYIVLFSSADGTVNGEDYVEYAVVRLDGENWESADAAENRITARREEDFEGWDAWKKGNKEGIDCTVTFTREGNRITVSTTNLGLTVTGVTILPDSAAEGKGTVFAALTGEQCAITNIRIL